MAILAPAPRARSSRCSPTSVATPPPSTTTPASPSTSPAPAASAIFSSPQRASARPPATPDSRPASTGASSRAASSPRSASAVCPTCSSFSATPTASASTPPSCSMLMRPTPSQPPAGSCWTSASWRSSWRPSEALATCGFFVKGIVDPMDVLKIFVRKRDPDMAIRYARIFPHSHLLLCNTMEAFGKRKELKHALKVLEHSRTSWEVSICLHAEVSSIHVVIVVLLYKLGSYLRGHTKALLGLAQKEREVEVN